MHSIMELRLSSHHNKNAWIWSLACLLSGLMVIGLSYASTLYSIGLIWQQSDTYAHGYLIIPITLFLIWRKRESLRVLVPRAMPMAVLGIMLSIFVGWLAQRAGILLLEQLAVF